VRVERDRERNAMEHNVWLNGRSVVTEESVSCRECQVGPKKERERERETNRRNQSQSVLAQIGCALPALDSGFEVDQIDGRSRLRHESGRGRRLIDGGLVHLLRLEFAHQMATEREQLLFGGDCEREDDRLLFGRSSVGVGVFGVVEFVRISELIAQMDFADDILDLSGHIGDDSLTPSVFAHSASVLLLHGDDCGRLNVFLVGPTASGDEVEEPKEGRLLVGFARKNNEEDELGESEHTSNAVRENQIEIPTKKSVNEPFGGNQKVGDAERQRQSGGGSSANDHSQSG